MFSFFSNRDRANRARIGPGIRVEGPFGPLGPNPNARPGRASRRVRATATGTVIEPANGHRYWKVKCDQDGETRLARTGALRVVANDVGIPRNEVTNVSTLLL